MQQAPSNKSRASGSRARKPATLINGRESRAQELIKCGCRAIVAVPYGGQAQCPGCGHEFRWPSRYDRPAREKLIVSLPPEGEGPAQP